MTGSQKKRASSPEQEGNLASKELRVLRLSETADSVLRPYTHRKGDVSLQVNHALLGTNLESLDVVPRSRAPGSGRQKYQTTSVTFEAGVYAMVQKIAKLRNISATSLIDAAIIQFFKPRAAGEKHVESDNSDGDKPKRGRR